MKSKIVSCFLILCLIISALYIDKMSEVSAAGGSKTRIQLRIDNRAVSGKTISIKKGMKKKIKVIVPQKGNYKITFRSNKGGIAAVSKTGKITAKRPGTAKVTVIAKSKRKEYKSWIKVNVVSADKKSDEPVPTNKPVLLQTDAPAAASDTPTAVPSVSPTAAAPTIAPTVEPTATPTESPDPAPDTGTDSDMYDITIRVNGNVFAAKLYQTETTEAFMQKLPLSVTMNELNGNEKYYYFSESFPTETERVSEIHAGDLKLYGSSCLVLFYESFSTSYSYTSLGYVEDPEGLEDALGTGSVLVDITGAM